MATDLESTLQSLLESNQQLTQDLATLRQHTVQAFNEINARIDGQTRTNVPPVPSTAVPATADVQSTSSAINEQLVDTKQFGKPPVLKKKSEFPTWAFKFSSFVNGANPISKEYMDWAEAQPDEIQMAVLQAQNLHSWQFSKQLYLALALQTEGTFNELVENVQEQNGSEAWRKLT